MRCPECNAKAKAGAKFCIQCGERIPPPDIEREVTPTLIPKREVSQPPPPLRGIELGVIFNRRCKKCGGDKFIGGTNRTGNCGAPFERQYYVCSNCNVEATDCCGNPLQTTPCLIPYVFVALGACSKALAFILS